MDEKKKRNLEKASDALKGDDRDLARALAELRALNAAIAQLSESLKAGAAISHGAVKSIQESLADLGKKEYPREIEIKNLPETTRVSFERPEWYKEAPTMPEQIKASVDWENMPRQKEEMPSWLAGALEALVGGIARIFSKPIGARLERGAPDRAQFMLLLDPETGRAFTKEDLRPLINIEQRIPPSGGSGSGGASGDVNVTDRAARLLGIIYGSQGQQLKQTATNYNLATELHVGGSAIDPRTIRALTSSDVVSAAQSGAWSVSISGTPDTNTTDRAARLLGIIYGDQGQLKQRASTREAETYDTNLAAVLGTASLIASGRLKTDGSGVTQPISAAALPLPSGAATEATLATRLSESDFDTKIGALTETAPASDTASSGLNGRLQRIAQRITSLIALIPAALTGSGNFKVSLQESNATQAISAASLPLPSGAATAAKQDTGNTSVASIDTKTPALGQALAAGSVPVVLTAAQITTLTPPAAITGFALEATLGTRLSESDFDTKTGSLTETAPATDTASSGLNGRLQRIAQRITSLISTMGSPFQAGGSIGNTTFGATQSGAWTVGVNNFPSTYDVSDRAARLVGVIYGNLAQIQQKATTFEQLTWDKNLETVLGTASLIASGRLKVDGSGVTQPISAASLPLPTGAATEATLATRLSESDFDTKIGSLTETAPATDTASSGLNGRLQRIAQRLTTINTTLGSPFQAGGSIGNTTFASTQSGAWTVGVNNFPSTYDVLDRAGRLLGVIYGSQGAQLSQRATTFEANTYDTNLATVLGTASLITGGRLKVEATQSGSPWGVNPTAETAGVGVGAAADAEAAGNGSVIAVLKRIRTLLGATLTVQQAKSATSAVTSVASSATSVSILASNANRLGATIFNDSTSILYLKLGATASTSSFTVKMAAGSYYELPTTAVYTGAIDGIWASANGNARITELT